MANLQHIQDCIDQLAALIQKIEAMPEVTTIQNKLKTIVIPASKIVMPDLIGHPTIPASIGVRAKREIATIRELPGLSIIAGLTGNPDRASRPVCANALFSQ